MFFSFVRSKLFQLCPSFTRNLSSIFINAHANANKNPIIQKITTTLPFVNHNFGKVVARNRMFARTFTTVKSTPLTESWCPRKMALQLTSIMTKFRKTSYVTLAMCLFLKVERVPFSGRRHLVIRSPKHLSLFGTQIFSEIVVEVEESRLGRVLPSADPKTLRFASIACKVGQGMHDVLELKQDFNVVAYEIGLDSKSNPGFTVGRQTSYNTSKRWSSKGFMSGNSTKHLEGREWKVNVFDSPKIFAGVVPGHIIICTGLLDISSDDEVASVIGHEVGHVIGRHYMDDVMWYLPKRIFIATANFIMSFLHRHDYIRNDQSKNKFHDIVNNFPCRRLEFEADHIGMMLMASAGYDPQAAPILLSKHACSPSTPHDTHPNGYDRIKYLKSQERMNKAMNMYKDVTLSS